VRSNYKSSFFKLLVASIAAFSLLACDSSNESKTVSAAPKSAENTAITTAITSVDAIAAPAMTQDTAVKEVARESFKSHPANAAQINLPVPSAEDLAPLKNQSKKGSESVGKAYQIGFNRVIGQSTESKSAMNLLNWGSLSNGNSVATVQINSAGAKSLRIGVVIEALPANAILRVHNGQGSEALQIPGSHVLKLIQSNIQADGDSQAARTYWTPTTIGESTTLEIEIPVGTDKSSVKISIPSISHAIQIPLEAAFSSPTDSTKAAGTCNVDATCTLPPAANAVAQMDYVVNGASYVCTGTLLADSIASLTPYFLTANHCISSQTIASTLATYWFWRSNACNSTTVNPGWRGRYSGATFLYGNSVVSPGTSASYTPSGTDTSFLRLNDTPPAGVMFAGWDANPQAISSTTNYIGLHHPLGDKLKRSDGKITTYGITLADGEYSSTTKSTLPKYRVQWSAGVTEGGSSGSPLFLDGTSTNPKVVGQLYGGTSSCTTPTGTDSYGRFDQAFAASLSDWLSPGKKPVYRFYNTNLGTHFFTMSGTERNNIIATLPQYKYEGISFYAYPAQSGAANLSPVYRFFNTNTGAHFYTINIGERDTVIATLPQFSYEGIKWYALTSGSSGTTPLYRFFHQMNGTHFYTISSVERDNVINSIPVYSYENVAYYVWPTQ
jgi:lysyl endopeptidase